MELMLTVAGFSIGAMEQLAADVSRSLVAVRGARFANAVAALFELKQARDIVGGMARHAPCADEAVELIDQAAERAKYGMTPTEQDEANAWADSLMARRQRITSATREASHG